MKTRQAIERMTAAIMTDITKNRRAYAGAPTRRSYPCDVRRLRRGPVRWLLAGALVVVPLISLGLSAFFRHDTSDGFSLRRLASAT